MTKTRLEAFSDGVFAISITLLVLNVRIPGVEIKTNGDLIMALKAAWTVAIMPFPAAVLATHPLFPSAILLYC